MKRTPLKRSRLKARPLIRSWHEAREKVEKEGRCRSCGSTGPLQTAHTIARAVQDVEGEAGTFLWVNPDSVIPLCPKCHMDQHAKRLDILPLLSLAELKDAAKACRKAGLDARRQLTGRRS